MNIQQPIRMRGETRLFERITVDGSLRIDESDYQIRDLSVGGVSVVGAVPDWEKGDIRRVQFDIHHGELGVSGKLNCECLENGGNGITRFRLVNPSEDLAEFLRAVTLRNVSGAEYDAGWLSEKSHQLKDADAKPRRTPASLALSLPMLVLAMFMLLLAAFVIRKTDGEAYWVAGVHEIVAPLTGQITSLSTGPFNVGDPITEIIAMTIDGEDMPFTMTADVASISVAWRFSTGDRVEAGDILGHLHNVPRNDGQFHAIVSLQVPFFQLTPGDSIVMGSVSGQRFVGQVQRMLAPEELPAYTTTGAPFSTRQTYFLALLEDAAAELSGSPEIWILDTVLQNGLR